MTCFYTDPSAGLLAHIPLIRPPGEAHLLPVAPPPAAIPLDTSATPLPSTPLPSSSSPAFVLSKASAPIPGKLVAKVKSLQFVENEGSPARQHSLAREACHNPQHGRLTPQREVSSLLTWECAFTTYIAILAEARPDLVKSRLAYLRNIVREASRFGGDGWKTYNYVFRSQAAVDQHMDWADLNPSMMMAFMATRPFAQARPLCHLCQEADHFASNCALAPLAPPSKSPAAKQPHRSTPSPDTQLCISWNQGACMLPGSCRYKHVCATCGDPHRARDCALTPADSLYKRPLRKPAKPQAKD